MNGFIKLLRYTLPFKGLAILNVVFNILSILFSLFSIALILPFLKLLFGQSALVTVKPEFSFSIEGLSGSFNYYLSNLIVTEGHEAALIFICFVLVITILLKNVFRYLALFVMVSLRNNIVSDLRSSLYRHILVLPLSYFSEEKKGDLISRMSSDILQIEVAIMSSLEALFKEPLTIVIYLVSLIWISPVLTLIVFVTLPLVGILIGRIGKLLKNYSKRGQAKFGDLISLYEETLMGVRIIKAYNSQEFFMRRFKTENDLYTRINIASNRTGDSSSPISETLSVVVLAFILWVGGNMVLSNNDALNAESFIAFIAIFSQLLPPAKSFSTAYSNMQKGMASLDRVNEVIQSEEVITQAPDALPIEGLNSSIEFKNVSFKYADEYVLRNINLKIEKGKTVALVGPSGSGKSTLTDLIPRFYDPVEGEVLIDGVNIKKLEILKLRALMAVVAQESILFNDTIYNNIAFGKTQIAAGQVEHAAQVANAQEFIVTTEKGYQTNIGDRGNKLSGGQRQRLSIARAIHTNPDILILDEATSALDTASERLVQEALNNIMENRTTIVIAHRLSTIHKADLIVVLDKGKIVQTGNHQELINQTGLYKQLHDMQQILEG
ncbi:MAG: ATP-binding cassette domain-containing protein [Bacteroidia bacterium]|nr:ATP-binding cassette domain-containing protein [Bacteroidia bacterium]MCF8426549.1 ATP-binding cassette domain-containing protein [Bacteroidia bacterium]